MAGNPSCVCQRCTPTAKSSICCAVHVPVYFPDLTIVVLCLVRCCMGSLTLSCSLSPCSLSPSLSSCLRCGPALDPLFDTTIAACLQQQQALQPTLAQASSSSQRAPGEFATASSSLVCLVCLVCVLTCMNYSVVVYSVVCGVSETIYVLFQLLRSGVEVVRARPPLQPLLSQLESLSLQLSQ